MVKRGLVLAYGLVSYVAFLVVFVYSIGFVGNLVVPKTIDSGAVGSTGIAILVNVILLSLFAIQHTIMARPGFKARAAGAGFLPAAIERSTFVLLASLLLALIMWQWRPIPDVIWSVDGPLRLVLSALFALGWGVVLISTFLIDHFDLFGLKQVWYHFQGKPYPEATFVERSLYRVVRHPIMLGFVIAFWATPTMTAGHLLFAGVTTAYIILGIHIEERDLRKMHGVAYDAYRSRVSMLLPLPPKPRDEPVPVPGSESD